MKTQPGRRCWFARLLWLQVIGDVVLLTYAETVIGSAEVAAVISMAATSSSAYVYVFALAHVLFL